MDRKRVNRKWSGKVRSGQNEEWKERGIEVKGWEDEDRAGRLGNRNRTEQEEEWKGSVIERKRSSVD